jgi:hypothetical protein
MEIKKAYIFSTSSDQHNQSLLFNSLRLFDTDNKIDVIYDWKDFNKDSLSSVYNMAIKNAIELDVDCLILAHDDIILEEDPFLKLEYLFDDFDLVGVAGTSSVEIKSPCLWHLMGGGLNSNNLHGVVQHISHDGNKLPSYFGSTPAKVIMIDGVFMAMNRKCIQTLEFDESIPSGYHFYDLVASLDACKNKLNVGVGDILITHKSHGLREFTSEWLEGEKYFLNKYKKYQGNRITL